MRLSRHSVKSAAKRLSAEEEKALRLAFGALLMIGCMSACSAEPSAERRHDNKSEPMLIGEQIYACADGSQFDADFLKDGLTLSLTRLPNGSTIRLTAPATGLTFIGNDLNVAISGADELTLIPAHAARISCKRIRSGSQAKRLQPP